MTSVRRPCDPESVTDEKPYYMITTYAHNRVSWVSVLTCVDWGFMADERFESLTRKGALRRARRAMRRHVRRDQSREVQAYAKR